MREICQSGSEEGVRLILRPTPITTSANSNVCERCAGLGQRPFRKTDFNKKDPPIITLKRSSLNPDLLFQCFGDFVAPALQSFVVFALDEQARF